MYGPLDQDPVVRYYDVAFLEGSEYDEAWYAQKAATYGGPVLDLACGAGRISLALAQFPDYDRGQPLDGRTVAKEEMEGYIREKVVFVFGHTSRAFDRISRSAISSAVPLAGRTTWPPMAAA